MNDGLLIEVIHGDHDVILGFLFRSNTDVSRTERVGEEALDEVKLRAVGGSVREFKVVRALLRDLAPVSFEMCAE
jgi:hypothetical protein